MYNLHAFVQGVYTAGDLVCEMDFALKYFCVLNDIPLCLVFLGNASEWEKMVDIKNVMQVNETLVNIWICDYKMNKWIGSFIQPHIRRAP